jgi:ABC-2 type transport system ATP-binding protein
MAAFAIHTSDLTKVFPGGMVGVDRLELRIRPGGVYGLIGPNGAGKTTVLRLLMGLLWPQSGRVEILGEDLWHAPRSLRSRVAYIAQTPQLYGWMTLEDFCRYASRLYPRWDAAYARSLAARWHLPLSGRIGRLSAGEQRKAALLIAFAAQADILLLDEPAAGLDPIARRALIDEIVDFVCRGTGSTVLLSTHLLEDLERVVDHVGIMDNGRLVISEALEDLRSTVKRVQVVFEGDVVPPNFVIPGALWTENSGPVATALTQLANEAQLESIRHWPGARMQVFPLNLQEIFLAFFKQHPTTPRAGEPSVRLWSDR